MNTLVTVPWLIAELVRTLICDKHQRKGCEECWPGSGIAKTKCLTCGQRHHAWKACPIERVDA